MTAIIPPLFSLWTGTLTCAAIPRPLQMTLGIQPTIGLTAAQQNTAVQTALVGATGKPFSAANMDNQYTFVESKILYRNSFGVLVSHIDPLAIIGTKVIDPLPVNTSVVIRKNTAFAGKQYRGRILCPPLYFTESDVDSGGLIAAPATYQSIWTAAYNSLVSNGVPPVLLHDDPLIAPTNIVSLTVNQRIGTIGKRLRP